MKRWASNFRTWILKALKFVPPKKFSGYEIDKNPTTLRVYSTEAGTPWGENICAK